MFVLVTDVGAWGTDKFADWPFRSPCVTEGSHGCSCCRVQIPCVLKKDLIKTQESNGESKLQVKERESRAGAGYSERHPDLRLSTQTSAPSNGILSSTALFVACTRSPAFQILVMTSDLPLSAPVASAAVLLEAKLVSFTLDHIRGSRVNKTRKLRGYARKFREQPGC